MMHTGKLGSQGLVVSAEGLGCMGMSVTYGPSNEQENLATLHRAVELGITLFDTAEVYGPYLNEQLLGKAFAGNRRDTILLSTKVGFGIEDGKLKLENGSPVLDSSPEHLKKAIEGSLARLATTYLDLVYLHRIDPKVPIEDAIGVLSDLVKAGKIRYIGVSEAAPETIRRAHAVHPLTAVQTEYSLFERGVETNEVLTTVRELSIGFVAYAPLGRGFLTGTMQNTDKLDPTDFRKLDPRLQGDNLEANLKLVAAIEKIAAAKGVIPSQLAIAWTMSQGAVPIPGTRRIKYLEENVAAADITLTDEELKALDEAAPVAAASGDRYPAGMMAALTR